MDVRIEQSWRDILASEWDSEYFVRLTEFVRGEYGSTTIYPPASKIFAAFDACSFDNVKVVILGQDPYPGVGQANGLCFSVNPGVAVPRSLNNIYNELASDLNATFTADGDLSRWARQGVLLLNSVLTVRAGSPASHQGKGWERFTDVVIERLASRRSNLVFILWGAYAQKKGAFIDRNRHCVIESAHPSPLSASKGFFGSRPFSRTNQYLESKGIEPIKWI